MSLFDKVTNLELAQILAERLIIAPNDWHRLKGNRQAQALQQTIAGLILLLKGDQIGAIERLKQAVGWLDRSINTPACPTHKSSASSVNKQYVP